MSSIEGVSMGIKGAVNGGMAPLQAAANADFDRRKKKKYELLEEVRKFHFIKFEIALLTVRKKRSASLLMMKSDKEIFWYGIIVRNNYLNVLGNESAYAICFVEWPYCCCMARIMGWYAGMVCRRL